MTKEEISEWALSHGFSDVGDGILLAHYGEGDVRITFGERTVKVTAHSPSGSNKLVSGHPKRMFLNEHGMLEGAGLLSTFTMGALYRGAPVPVWFTSEYRAAVGLPAPEEDAAPAP